MREAWKLAPRTLTLDGLLWVEIHRASALSRTGVRALKKMIAEDAIRSRSVAGVIYIPNSAVLRLREHAEYSNPRPRDKLRYRYKWEPRRSPRTGPHAGREVQDVLPISSGRSGKGWSGPKLS